MANELKAYELDEDRYVALMTKLIGEAESLQNCPPEFVPIEDNAGRHVLKTLEPHTTENGGPLLVERVAYKEGRGNIIITYPSAKADAKSISFVGSHLDVVPADPKTWKFDPFSLGRDGDRLTGRGTTDCLGHVGLLTELFVQLATNKPALNVTVAAVFIASEESSVIPEVGVDMLVKDGKLDFMKNGPVYWVDSADSQPCIGTAAALDWTIRVSGKLFHSGLPHKAINSIELGMEALNQIQTRFYKDFPPHPREAEYKFATPSTMKPTQIKCSPGSSNQIPPWCEMSGDIRLTPFYEVEKCIASVESYVKDINDNINSLPVRGGASKYELPEENLKGKVELIWNGEPYKGIACSIESQGFKALESATKEIIGEAKPYSIGGSLPLVKELQDEGFDVQICGYGKSEAYHADNEYALLSDMKNAHRVFCSVIQQLNESL
eukprot:CAMPEP_0119119090 /NCGR_PEP_ID=MMETSP1310-20130426/734_1 /TAXON_ID=464262 /ORGANISM="Genus nov. species nov., Strain RCC2339" /LENGTH=437 /DNA_ID=CAMNT_0007108505 /DNA_START=115 /DNA_END=1428 /DNA_ORIENTATION=-